MFKNHINKVKGATKKLKVLREKNITKSTIIYILLSIVISSPLFSQETTINKGKMNIGFDAGLQFTGINDPYMLESKGGIGYNFGPTIEYYVSDLIKIKAALHYDNRAFTLKTLGQVVGDSGYVGKTSYYDVLEEFKVNYLTIPLSFIYIKGEGKFKFFLQGTLYYSVYLNSEQTGYRDVFISPTDAPEFHFENNPELNSPGHHYLDPIIHKFNTSDIGMNVFIGGIYYIQPNLGISLSPGFSYAFSNVWEDPTRTATWSQLYKVTLGVVYSIN